MDVGWVALATALALGERRDMENVGKGVAVTNGDTDTDPIARELAARRARMCASATGDGMGRVREGRGVGNAGCCNSSDGDCRTIVVMDELGDM